MFSKWEPFDSAKNKPFAKTVENILYHVRRDAMDFFFIAFCNFFTIFTIVKEEPGKSCLRSCRIP